MSSNQASEVKIAGHVNEYDFAKLIGGQVDTTSPTQKKDVMDYHNRSYSVKGGTWWQIFLYGRDRFVTNTIFQEMGNVADIMIACIDAFPPDYNDYKSNKIEAKKRLQPHMRALLVELQKPEIFRTFLEKALFDIGNVEYLSVFLGAAKLDANKKIFHVFHKDDVIAALMSDITLRNSKARNNTQMSDLKVTFLSNLHRRNIGEIEDRHDSAIHYRQMKFRLNAKDVCEVLANYIKQRHQALPQVITYGKAVNLFRD